MSEKAKEYRVEGITCLDCAAKFEKRIATLPGITKARFDPLAGRLIVEGDADIEEIIKEGLKENYKIMPVKEKTALKNEKFKIDSELLRVVFSSLSILAGFILKMKGLLNLSVPFFLSAVIIGGFVNFKKAFYSLGRLELNINVLMSFAVIGAIAIGELEEAGVVSILFSVSEMLESWTVDNARNSLKKLIEMSPKTARVKKPWGVVEVPVEKVKVGDIVEVLPGEKVSMDGIVVKGASSVNEAAITGESMPVEKAPGDEVFAGTINLNGFLEIKATKLSGESTLAKIVELVKEAEQNRPKIQAFIDRFAAIYTPVVLTLAGILTFLPPILFGYDWHSWIYRGLALLVVSCPCALVLSAPVAVVSAISRAARSGILIKGGEVLEKAGALKVVAFDKTGTLTKGVPVVTDVIPLASSFQEEVLYKAASVERMSEHPIAKAIVKEAQIRKIEMASAVNFTALAGKGTKGVVDGETILIGNERHFGKREMISGEILKELKRIQEEGKTTVLVGTEEKILGIIALSDEVRETGKMAVAKLKGEGIKKTVLLTGDNRTAARAISKIIGVDEHFAELLPHEKVRVLEDLKKEYKDVAMVGDGINDAPALAAATVGIAMGQSGTDVALETADVVLMTDDLIKIALTVSLGKKTRRIIRQNIFISLFLKFAAIAATFPGWLTLYLAIIADMGATLLVTINGMRLLKFKDNF
ncbi:Cd2+/Zn2+-exporting ATPase [Caldanaerovirga acetigignens]|uniref:Cd(2+)-exporting ATPase n=1 Tax=Caldanaerovirga acetigignens TaxID=447595 RepID=A0A1M7K181_9FIRM|nr:heavy metal translocating P-type ATPase [Caldanaerovirga acetigignens]SHM59018.1 Cd2+/Zn2+-exporting ATPase [Caldanaerovirga acetigignens]